MDKGLTHFMRGRARLALLLMVCMVAIVALPAFAHAAPVFSAEYPAPGALLHGQPAVVSVDVAGAVLNPKSGVITVNSVAYKAYVTLGAAGSWSASEALVGGVYKTTWTWHAGTGVASMSVYPATLAVGGPYTVTASVNDTAGTVWTDPTSWSFSIAAAPVVPPVVVASSDNSQICWACHEDFKTDNSMGPDCLSCHANGYQTPSHLAAGNAPGATIADGHKISGTLLGPKTKFDGSQGVTLQWESEIATTNPTYLTNLGVSGSVTTGQVGTLSTNWTFPTQSVFWGSMPAGSGDNTAPPTATSGLTSASVILCTDCHSSAGITWGPHGAISWGMDPNYPGDYSYAELTKYVTANLAFPTWDSRYSTPLSTSGIAMFPGAATHSDITSASVVSTVGITFATPPSGMTNPIPGGLANRTDGTSGATAVICAKCHDLENFISAANGGVNAVEGANTAHDSHHQDQLDGSAQCVNCHVGIPHGWTRPRLLVNTDVDTAPIRDAQQLGTTRATSTGEVNTGDTRKLTAGFGAGFNGQGMQSLSGWDQHTLAGTPGHVGLANWTEASCQACGDHAGEDGVRIKEGE